MAVFTEAAFLVQPTETGVTSPSHSSEGYLLKTPEQTAHEVTFLHAALWQTGILDSAFRVSSDLNEAEPGCFVCWDLPFSVRTPIGGGAYVPQDTLPMRVVAAPEDLIKAGENQRYNDQQAKILHSQIAKVEAAIHSNSIAKRNRRGGPSVLYLEGQRDKLAEEIRRLELATLIGWFSLFKFQLPETGDFPVGAKQAQKAIDDFILASTGRTIFQTKEGGEGGGKGAKKTSRPIKGSAPSSDSNEDGGSEQGTSATPTRSQGRLERALTVGVRGLITTSMLLSAASPTDAGSFIISETGAELSAPEYRAAAQGTDYGYPFGYANDPYYIQPEVAQIRSRVAEEQGIASTREALSGDALEAFDAFLNIINSAENELSQDQLNIAFPFSRTLLLEFFKSLDGSENKLVILARFSAFARNNLLYAEQFQNPRYVDALSGKGNIEDAKMISDLAKQGNLQDAVDGGFLICQGYSEYTASFARALLGLRATEIAGVLYPGIDHVFVVVEDSNGINRFVDAVNGTVPLPLELQREVYPQFDYTRFRPVGKSNNLPFSQIEKEIIEYLMEQGNFAG